MTMTIDSPPARRARATRRPVALVGPVAGHHATLGLWVWDNRGEPLEDCGSPSVVAWAGDLPQAARLQLTEIARDAVPAIERPVLTILQVWPLDHETDK